jgi:6-pyruvoyltetrahydropterin/6-carboxytetrahydropterin synthase
MISVCKTFEFSAAHHLPDHEGACKHLHGHTYKLEVEVTGPIRFAGPSRGMIVDFSMLKEMVNETVLSVHDHTFLNTLHPNPTAELMTAWMVSKLEEAMEAFAFDLIRVRLWETPTSYAEWRKE